MAKKSLKLILEIIEATNLPAFDDNGKSDPYVKVKDSHIKTNVIDKELNPKWNFKASVELEPRDKLEFELLDKDLISDDKMGIAVLSLKDLYKGERQEFIIPIKVNKPLPKPSTLKVAVTPLDFGKDKAAEDQQKKLQEEQARKAKEEEQKKKQEEARKQHEQEQRKLQEEQKKEQEQQKKEQEQQRKQEDAQKQHEQEMQREKEEAFKRNMIFGVVVAVTVVAIFAYSTLKNKK